MDITLNKCNIHFDIIVWYISPKTYVSTNCFGGDNTSTQEQPATVIRDFSLDITNGSSQSCCAIMKRKYNFHQCVTQPMNNIQTTTDIVLLNYQCQNTSTVYCCWSDHSLLNTVH